jgi:hypothetical protein
MTKPGALLCPETGTLSLRKQLQPSAKHQPIPGKLIHKNYRKKDSTFSDISRLS